MKISGRNVLLTGATGGIGHHIAHALMKRGVNLSMVAYPGTQLQQLSKDLAHYGGKTIWYDKDLRNPDNIHQIVEETKQSLGPVDILINNAAIEITAPYHKLPLEDINSIMDCNLRAPLLLTRLVLEQMLPKNTGHIVNIASLAGKSGPSCQEVYAATKAGLINFTSSLRATYRNTGVNASVICPGFVEAGIYERLHTKTGVKAPGLLGTSKPEKVSQAVINAIEKGRPEIIINPIPVRPLFAITELLPALGERLTAMTGAHAFFDKAATRLSETD